MATTDVSGTWNLDYNNYYACGDQVLSCTTEDFQCGCSLHKLCGISYRLKNQLSVWDHKENTGIAETADGNSMFIVANCTKTGWGVPIFLPLHRSCTNLLLHQLCTHFEATSMQLWKSHFLQLLHSYWIANVKVWHQ